MTCNFCGAQLDESLTTCLKCGAAVESASDVNDEPTVLSEPNEDVPQDVSTSDAPAYTPDTDNGDAAQDPEGFPLFGEANPYDSEEAVRMAAMENAYNAKDVMPRKKGSVLPLIISLVLLVGLAVGAYFLLFANEASSPEPFNSEVAEYAAAMSAGDLTAMSALKTDTMNQDNTTQSVFGPLSELMPSIQTDFPDALSEAAYADEGTFLKEFSAWLGLRIIYVDGVVADDGLSGEARCVVYYSIDGINNCFAITTKYVKVDTAWKLDSFA